MPNVNGNLKSKNLILQNNAGGVDYSMCVGQKDAFLLKRGSEVLMSVQSEESSLLLDPSESTSLVIEKDTIISQNLMVEKNITVEENLTVEKNVTLNGKLNLSMESVSDFIWFFEGESVFGFQERASPFQHTVKEFIARPALMQQAAAGISSAVDSLRSPLFSNAYTVENEDKFGEIYLMPSDQSILDALAQLGWDLTVINEVLAADVLDLAALATAIGAQLEDPNKLSGFQYVMGRSALHIGGTSNRMLCPSVHDLLKDGYQFDPISAAAALGLPGPKITSVDGKLLLNGVVPGDVIEIDMDSFVKGRRGSLFAVTNGLLQLPPM